MENPDINVNESTESTELGFGIGFNSSYNQARFNLTSINISSGIGFLADTFAETIIGNTNSGIDINIGYLPIEEKVQAEAELALGKFAEADLLETVDAIGVEVITGLGSQEISEIITGMGVIYSRANLSAKLIEEINNIVEGVSMYYLSSDITETVGNTGVLAIAMIRNIALSEQISGTSTVSQKAMLSNELLETITSTAAVSQNVGLGNDIAENVSCDVQIASKVSLVDELFELVSGSADIVAFDERICQINTTLKPHDVLIIDASNYTVRLNNKNAISLHSGEWLDELDRNTVSIDVSASSGLANLSTRVIYTERYL